MDQATAVFSTRAVTDGAVGTGAEGLSGSGGSSGSDGSSRSERSGDAGTGAAESGLPGDARLRAAVAAWVAGADTDPEADPDAEASSGDAEGGNGDADAAAVSGASGASGEVSTADADDVGEETDAAGDVAGGGRSSQGGASTSVGATDVGEEPEGDTPSETGAEAEDADGTASAAGAATEGAGESGGGDEPRAAVGSGSVSTSATATEGDTDVDVVPADAERSAADAESASGREADAGAEPAASASGGTETAASASASASASTELEADASAAPAAGPRAGTEPAGDPSTEPGVAAERATDAADAESASGGKADAGEAPAAGTSAGTEPAAGPSPSTEPGVAAERDADAAESASAPDADADAEPAASADAKPEADAEPPAAEAVSARDADAASKAAGRDSGEPSDEGTEPSPEDSPKDSPKGPAEEPKAPKPPLVDQPTGVFRAPRRPAVDQPTTMLKLGSTKPPTDKPVDTPVPPAERTSKFVALKPLDEPAPAKPKATPAPGATAALPQVGPERTTQQPLPPKPPLDLLAELTNTPPPRQTPVRTIVRRVKIWTPLVLLLAVIFAVVQAVRPLPAAGLTLTADATYTFEGGTLDLPWPGQGQSAIEVEGVGSLGTDGKQTAAPIASVAKIMTAYVILQDHPLKGDEGGEKITVDQQAEDESKNVDESTAPMTKGQQFTERQMLQLLMIPSGNNAARLLARWDSDDKTFVAKMNDAAKKLGMTNSTYTDPSGLEKTTVSTATDQLKLAKEVMQNPVFASIVGMASAKIPGLDGTIYNNNDLLVNQVGVIGLKTGSSTPAGGNLVWAATKTVNGKTQTVYGAVLGQNAGTGKVWDSLKLALTNSQKLIDTVQQSLTSATVVKKGDVVGYVDDQLGGQTPVVATKNMTAVGWPGLKTKLSIGTAGGDTVPHSGKAGTVVGELTVGDGSSHAVKIPVALQSDLAEPGFGAKLTRVG
ncbi:serine hydrolase [Streptomyces sp. NBC_00564]|uniref:serine hydrolase n=1 Tax=Streptomyces sp. NBC_00564 TaxID=2903663 RepID=UPI00352C3333|nr:D-alanyl-D-alanine carboxypeptidase [Streptomyces sp. NBC_00564]